ncbi:peptide chain release factor N(5)-glutamine methyltransferase [bacterium]|nr:peptide chain release factor N(5)-glutamine methyltransferase [Candidatus Elulimicrobium humile]
MNIKEINLQLKQKLQNISPTPDLDADLILEYVLGLNKLDRIMQENYILSNFELEAIDNCLEMRLNKIPMAYIIGYKEFYGRKFIVNNDVLIPRPETEAIIDITKQILDDNSPPIIWEIGTGSGCIAITLALEIPQAKIIASDISPPALQIAKNNAIILIGQQNTITWLEGDLLFPFAKQQNEPKLIIANLPYLEQNQYTDDSILAEPNIALYSDTQGLEHYMRLLEAIQSLFLIWQPKIILEINPEQAGPLENYIKSLIPKSKITVYKDLQGLDRHILIEK